MKLRDLAKLLNIEKPKPVLQPMHVRNPYADAYYGNLEKIEVMWSVLRNLNAFHTPQAYQLEQLCKQNIVEYKQYISLENVPPLHAPAFVRLAMLYEKQERWDDGIKVCVDAIKSGAYEDGSNGKMYGRLARLIKKSGKTYGEEILKLTKGAL